MDDIYKILKNTIQIKKRTILIVFDYMMTDMLSNVPSNWELQQIAFNLLSDTEFMNLYIKCTAKPFSFLVIDTTLV